MNYFSRSVPCASIEPRIPIYYRGGWRIISLLLNLTKLTTLPHLSGNKKYTQEQKGNWKWKMENGKLKIDVGQENSTDCGGNFVPASGWRFPHFGCVTIKRRIAVKSKNNEASFRRTRKRSPQFADANEELRLSLCNDEIARYFLDLGASIIVIRLPSNFGIISTLPYSSRSVAKRSKRIWPCSLNTMERPRKNT